jgi:hypothetical protein
MGIDDRIRDTCLILEAEEDKATGCTGRWRAITTPAMRV